MSVISIDSSAELAQENFLATVDYEPATQHESHFGRLKISTARDQSTDGEHAYHAGYLEGYATADEIYNFYMNQLCSVNCSGFVPMELVEFVNQQNDWVEQ